MGSTRRQFLEIAALGSAAAVLGPKALFGATATTLTPDPAKKKLKLLVLGGTRFLGPAIVERAQQRGHTLTLFNRGKSNPGMFPGVKELKGDRNPDEEGGLDSLATGEWDAVIDTSAHFPRWIKATADLLKDRAGQYVYVSSLSAIADVSKPDADESTPVATMEDPTLETFGDQFQYYGPLKALSEAAAEASMPGRATIVRPGLIVGYRDNIPRFTYWPVRVERGGEVIAPGSPDDPVQFIDVRDLARFIVHAIETRAFGVFNVNGPTQAPTNIAEVIYGCKAVTGTDATFTWVDADFLEARQISGWGHLPLWIPPKGEYAGFHQIDCSKAIKAGLVSRPLAETVEETLAWYHAWPKDKDFPWRGVLTADKESETLTAWHARDEKPANKPASTSG